MYNEDGLEQAEEVISVVFFFLSGNQVLFLFQQLEDSLPLRTHSLVDVEVKPEKVDFLLSFFLLYRSD